MLPLKMLKCASADVLRYDGRVHDTAGSTKPWMTDAILQLLRQRKQQREPGARPVLSKQVAKDTRKALRAWRTQLTGQLLEKFEGLKGLQQLQALPTAAKGVDTVAADVFATFLGEIYSSVRECPAYDLDTVRQVPRFELEELTCVVQALKNGRCADTNNCVAEMI